ncbi:ABC transporter substrate-binding protein [Massilia sp. W12]|uniref:ABC transporter substrate-binding protein n=1 Tax=Massilia sp. W12 TaxID=3126507 RepID=UPI0030CFBE79
MKRLKHLAIALAAVFACSAPQVMARTLDEIKADGKIILATEGLYPPFNYMQGSKLTGFEVELAEAVVKKMGLKFEWKSLSFDALLAGLRQDRWDLVIASFGITEERSKAVLFTAPHYCSGGVIVSRDGSVKTVGDLSGKVVAAQTGTTYFENVKKVPGIKEVKNYPADTDARAALTSGRVDAWVSDRFVAKTAMEANPAGMKLGDFLFVERVASAVKKGNTSLAGAWDKALAEVMADGTYKALSEKYMKEDVRCK